MNFCSGLLTVSAPSRFLAKKKKNDFGNFIDTLIFYAEIDLEVCFFFFFFFLSQLIERFHRTMKKGICCCHGVVL